MADAKRDRNSVTTLIGVSSADGITPVVVYVDPVTHRLLVNSSSGGGTPGGSSTQVQYNNAGSFGGITGATTDGTTLTLVAPVLGAASATSINGLIITATTGGTLTIANSKTLTISNTLTFAGTDSSTVQFGAGGTVAYTGNKLSVFAATSSAELASVISDETGTGGLVFANTPTLITPNIGVATATRIGIGTAPGATTEETLLQPIRTTGSPTMVLWTGGAHTTLAASTEAIDVNINLARTVQFATGALTTQRAYVIQAPTYGFVGASVITTASTLYVTGAPIAGTNATITNAYAMNIAGSNSRIGTPAAGTPNSAVAGIGLEVTGTNNTTGGMNLTIANTSNGTSAFVDLFMQNDLADATGTHFAVVNLNSSTYTDTTFGTALAVANQLAIYGTDGPTLIGTAKSGSTLKFLIGGTALANVVATIAAGGYSGRIAKRALLLSAGSATPAINTDSYDVVHITAQSAAITSFTSSLTGTPIEGDTLRIDITDNGTARAITWGASFEASTVALPTTTVVSTRLDVGFFWNTVTSKWRCVAVA